MVASLVAQRVAAKREREYALADSIHAELTEMGARSSAAGPPLQS